MKGTSRSRFFGVIAAVSLLGAAAPTVPVAFEGIRLRVPANWQQQREGTLLVLTSPVNPTGSGAQIVIMPHATADGGNVQDWVVTFGKRAASHHGTVVRSVLAPGGGKDSGSVAFVVQTPRGAYQSIAFSAGRSANGRIVALFYVASDATTYAAYVPVVNAIEQSTGVESGPKKLTFWQNFVAGMRAAAIAHQQGSMAGGQASFTGTWGCISFQISGGDSVCPAGNLIDVRSDGTYVFHGLVGQYHASGDRIIFDSGGYASFGSGTMRSDGLIQIDFSEDGTKMIYYFKRIH